MMSIAVISDDHFMFTSENTIREICTPFLKKHSLTFFDFARMYNDGSCYLLSTDQRVIKYLLTEEKQIIAPIPDKLISKEFSYLIPHHGPYHEVMHHVAGHYDLRHGYDLFDCHENYIDVCCFGSDAKNDEVINLYLNNQDLFRNYFKSFQESVEFLLQGHEHDKIMLPQHMQLSFHNPVLIPNENDIININRLSGQYKNVIFSKAEINCIHQLILGYTAKETAKFLNVSPRTIEFHIDNIKNKLQCNKKSEAMRIILKYGNFIK